MTMRLFPDESVPSPPGAASTWFLSPAASCKTVSLGLLTCLLSCLSPLAASDLTPVALHTEYLTNPLGLDMPQPRLSWELKARSERARGLRQTAYQILVASTPALLIPNQADLWDSGEVVSDGTALIDYHGNALTSRAMCFWTVRVRDQDGHWSDWSASARWTMGLLSQADWTAKWIGTGESYVPVVPPSDQPSPDNTLPDPWLRRTVDIALRPKRATAFVASVGYHELYVNGRRVGDAVLAPSVTDNSTAARYVAYEIGDLLHPGKNVIGLWLGTGWSIFPAFATADKPRAPIAIGQIDMDFDDGSQQRIITDGSWKTHPSPNTLLGTWYFHNFGGELYDANLEIPGWAEVGLDDSTWKPAVVYAPSLAISADKVEPNRLVTELTPESVSESGPGVYRVDMGRNFAGWTEISVRGAQGDRIEFLFSEEKDKPITHALRNVLVIGASGQSTFRSHFNYSSGRWITIRGLRRAPVPGDIRGWLVRSDYTRATSFECSNPLFNEIYATALWTFESLSLGGYVVDCPQRERMGYGGDAHATTTTALSNYQLGAFYTKWAQDWRAVQGHSAAWGLNKTGGDLGSGKRLEYGNLPYTAPTYWGGGGPGWSGFCVHLPWELYRTYGDRRVLEAMLPTVERWLAFLETKAEAGLLRRWGGEWDFLGDWLWPGAKGVNGDTRETLFFNNCYWIYNLQTAAQMAAVLGRDDLAARWNARAAVARRAVHAEFFNSADHSYVNADQAYLAIALVAGVPPEGERAAIWERLEKEILEARGGHIHAGITGGAFLFKALMEAHRDDLIYAMVNQRDYPSWGNMLRAGATTFWESWEDDDGLSKLHSSYLYVGAWFIRDVLGIQPDPAGPGFKRVVIRPGPTNRPDLTSAKGHYDSIHGRIGTSWKRTAGRFQLNVEIPPNTSARLYLPASELKSVTEGGRKLAQSSGVKLDHFEGGQAILELQSGTYEFASVLAK